MLLVLALVGGACSDDGGSHSSTTTAAPAVETLRAEVLATLPHDPAVFTQGLELDGDTLYETSGLYGTSVVRAVDRGSGAVLRTHAFPSTAFAEGLTRVGDLLIVLTWRERTAYVLDAATLEVRSTLPYDGEGWGICALGDRVVTSDGTATLTLRDPASFAMVATRTVRLDGVEVRDLNELECVGDDIYANVWKTDRIMRIDAATGSVEAYADLPALRPASTATDPDAVLNGIAYDVGSDTFLITGKRWPAMYDVRFTRAS